MPIWALGFAQRYLGRLRRAEYAHKRERVLRHYPSASPGTPDWLAGTELKYGGLVTFVPRNKVSPKDPRSKEQLGAGGMYGGDRMIYNAYGEKYAQYLLPFVHRGEPVTLLEFGILQGSGLAIWCDLFPNGRVVGFDIDLGHFQRNLGSLTERGAFQTNRPELHEYDQFFDNTAYLGTILNGDRVDICIDDGFHSEETILMTMCSVMPYLADRFVYIVEDNPKVHKAIRRAYPDLAVDSKGKLTVITRA